MNREIKSVIIICLLNLTLFNLGKAQELSLVDEECPRTLIPFQVPNGLSGASYEWDFCTGDLLETPTASIIEADVVDAAKPEGMDIVFDGTNWYGFITNKNGFRLLRANFGDKLSNSPTFTDLGPPGKASLYSQPSKIRLFQTDEGLWYGFIINDASTDFGDIVGGRVIQLFFGSSLETDPVQAQTLPLEFFFPQAIDIVNDEGNYQVIIADYLRINGVGKNRISVLDFGNDMEELDTTYQTVLPTNTFNTWSLNAFKKDDRWQALIWGSSPGRNLHVLDFGDQLSNPPTVSNTPTPGFSTGTLQNSFLVNDGENFIAMGLSNSGNLYRLNFGDDLNTTPEITNFGNFDRLSIVGNQPSIAFRLAKDRSNWHAFAINRHPNFDPPFNVNTLIRLDFPNNCNAIPSTSSREQVNTEFVRPGEYTVNLNVLDGGGQVLETLADKITITNAVSGDFSIVNQCLGAATEFINASDTLSNADQTVSWQWDFGDGTQSSIASPIHIYQGAGIYPVRLTVTNRDMNGNITCQNTKFDTIRISGGPEANLEVKSINCNTGDVEFRDLSVLRASDLNNGARITDRVWSFGDNETYTAAPATVVNVFKGKRNSSFPVPLKPYTPGQNYRVSLTITDDSDCSSTISREISLRDEDRPNAGFSFNNACAGVPLQFTDQSQMPSNATFSTVDEWKWTVYSPEGIPIDSSELQNPVFRNFSVPGNYTVSLEARNTLACADSVAQIVNIKESIKSSFDASAFEGVAPLRINFSNETENAESFSWSFGDGSISTEASPTYTYQEPGLYEVIFQAKNALGCGTLFSRFVTVLESPTSLEDTLAQALKIYPNPVGQELKLEIEESLFSELSIRISDLVGKVLIDEDWKPAQGLLKINTDHLTNGIYLLILEAKGLRLVRRIVKY